MKKLSKKRRTIGQGIEELWQREVGETSPRAFAHRVGASQDLVLRLDIHKKLDKHRGCVNTVCFNEGCVKLSFHSGHTNNVFQAKMMPYSDDRSIVTCAADGQVRYAFIKEDGRAETTNLGKHQGRVHKLAIEPGSPHIFYSCGEDGLVQHFDLRTRTATELFTCHSFDDKSRYMPIVHLNAIAIDPRNPNIFAIAGSDEYARLYDIRKCKLDGSTDFGHLVDCFCPQHLIGDVQVGITGLAFSDQTTGIGCDTIVSSPQDVGSRPGPQVYKGHQNRETVKGVSFFGPNCEYVASGSDCGRIFIWRKKDEELLRVMPADRTVVNCIERHPHATILASSGIDNDIKVWTPKATERASLPVKIEELKFKRKKSMHQLSSDLIMRIFASGLEHRGDDHAERAAFVEYLMDFSDGDDGNSDDATDASSAPGDCIVN
ncbi:hypothetical protein MRB53_014408 [Persea americana]|uniref:Uncharacterized protein n=1 Tax=Persea americana TaxID=3435 RepID=A0ACC2KAR6_PERAE|nr:hypothetical protein MRB53_014408 [Persea americana]